MSAAQPAADPREVRGTDQAGVWAQGCQLDAGRRPEATARQVPGKGLPGRLYQKVAG
jgi:hypothetical protein